MQQQQNKNNTNNTMKPQANTFSKHCKDNTKKSLTWSIHIWHKAHIINR